MATRVLGVLRLSRASDESTSVVRQRQAIQRWADARGAVVVGWAEDVDVSGAVAPWKRPGLGEWLPSTIGKEVSEVEERLAWEESRADEWDAICAWKLDRISRRVVHTAQLVEWAEANGKAVASAEDGFDLSTPMGKVMFSMIAAFAEGELEAIKFRARSSFTHLMKQGRWRGGFEPYGYRPEKMDDGDGWRLVPDEVGTGTAHTVREIVRRTLEGEATNAVCRWLNEQGSPTSLDAQRIRNGKDPRGAIWRVGNLLKLLRSHTLLGRVEMTEEVAGPGGRKVKRTRLVRGEDGLPLQRAEPLISEEEWKRLQAKLDENSRPESGNRYDRSPLLRVAFCVCGEPMYRNNGRSRMYYRCSSRNQSGAECGKTLAISAEELESTVSDNFLNAVGDLEMIRRTFRPGSDHTAEIAEVTRALAELREDREAGLYSSEAGKKEYRESYLRLDGKRETLLSLPSQPDRWEESGTGVTYRKHFEALSSPADQNAALREAGVRAVVHAEPFPERTFAEVLAEVDPAMWAEEPPTEGEWRQTFGRVELILPANFRARIRRQTAQHDG
jgi:site-specific DNA recombinase